MDFSKLLDHPDKETIISKLVSGISPANITDWLKVKYPKSEQAHLVLSDRLLKSFSDNNMDLYESLKKNIDNSDKVQKKISESLMNNKTYRDRLNEIADNEIDIRKMMVETGILIKARIEQYFDKVQENPGNLKPDKDLIAWFKLWMDYLDRYDKQINNRPDQIIQHNVSIQTMDRYTVAVQETIRDLLDDMDPELAFVFIEKLSDKMEKLELKELTQPVQKKITIDDRLGLLKAVEVLHDGISNTE